MFAAPNIIFYIKKKKKKVYKACAPLQYHSCNTLMNRNDKPVAGRQ